MLRMFKNKRAQNTAEYAILIALVVGGVVAMQTYAQRALQGRLRDASVRLRDQTMNMNPNKVNGANTLQYEPYYTQTKSTVDTKSDKTEDAGNLLDEKTTYKRAGADKDVDLTTYNGQGVVGGTDAERAKGF